MLFGSSTKVFGSSTKVCEVEVVGFPFNPLLSFSKKPLGTLKTNENFKTVTVRELKPLL